MIRPLLTVAGGRYRPAARSVALASGAVLAAALVWLLAPQQNQVDNVWVLLGHLVPFVLATEAIASLRPEWFARLALRQLGIVACFVVFFCFFVPKLFATMLAGDFDRYYYWMLTTTPYLILSLALVFRLGGGSAETVRRASYANLLVMLSGLEDLAFHLVNHRPVPAVWDWADHITVFLGHPATRNEAFAFITVHVVLALLVLFVPARWLRRLRLLAPPARPAPGAGPDPTAGTATRTPNAAAADGAAALRRPGRG